MVNIDVAKFTPISLIRQVLADSPDSILFKLPTSINSVWKDITYAEFFADVERVAYHILHRKAWPAESIIGLWTAGTSYADVVHLFAVMRAGCVPHLINMELSKTLDGGILDLLSESNASGLFVDSSLLENDFSELNFTEIYGIKDISEYPDKANRDLLPHVPIEVPSDRLILLLNTSGTSGGRCKLVPYDFRMYSIIVKKRKYATDLCRGDSTIPHTTARFGSFCHVAQIADFMMTIALGGTLIFISPNFGSSTLLQMHQECHLTAFTQFTTFIDLHLKNSRKDRAVLGVLKSMSEILVVGSALPEDEVEWAATNEIKLMNAIGLTECGGVLVAWPWTKNPTYFSLLDLDGLHYELRPVLHSDRDVEITMISDRIQNLKEFIVLSDSMDCPHPRLRSKVDGHFHTGDIVEEIPEGFYVYKGRLDDFIKMENARICDTVSIENHVRKTCGDIVHACVVIGYGRPSPTLLVEPSLENYDEDQLTMSIEQQLASYNVHVYQHERVTRDHIFVVPKGSLPRTLKGNIRRKVSEQLFSQRLDELHGPVKTV